MSAAAALQRFLRPVPNGGGELPAFAMGAGAQARQRANPAHLNIEYRIPEFRMTHEEITEYLRRSLAIPNRDSSAWSPPHRDRDHYLDGKRAELVASLVEPFSIEMHPGEDAALLGHWEDREYMLFIVAKHDCDVLLFNPETRLFSLGLFTASGTCVVTGYSSPDALAEWIT